MADNIQKLLKLRNSKRLEDFQKLWSTATPQEQSSVFEFSIHDKYQAFLPTMVSDLSPSILRMGLDLAAHNGQLRCVTFLVEDAQVDPNCPEASAFYSACMSGHHKVVKYLIPLTPDNEYYFGLYASAQHQHLKTVELLIDALGMTSCDGSWDDWGSGKDHEQAIQSIQSVLAQRQNKTIAKHVDASKGLSRAKKM